MQHHSAFLELFIYHFLLARGCKVIEIEPKLEHTEKSPDFFVENDKQQRFYVEVVQASGLSNQEASAQARLSTALAAIDDTPSPLHFLDLKVTGQPAQPLSTKKLRTALKSWIASLPEGEGAKKVAPFVHEEHEAKILITAWPRNKPDQSGKAIGIQRTPVIQVNPSQEIFPALKGKAGRYGKLDHPYLVVINGLSMNHDETAVLDALLGKEAVRLSKGPNGEEIVQQIREPNGVWHGPREGEARNTRLSGVLALKQVDPWNFASKTGLLVPNPRAEKPLPQLGLGTNEMVISGDKYLRKEGKQMHELVGLPAPWPEE